MKRVTILLGLVMFLASSCEKIEQNPQVSNVSFTTCKGDLLKNNSIKNNVDVGFTNEGVQITYYNFAVTCDFTTVDVTHTFVNGVLNITQQGFPNQANCKCYTDVSYKIDKIKQNEVNVIFINGEQVYCHNDNVNEEGYVTFGANYHVINCISTVTVFIDDENIGTLQQSVDTISECGEEGNLTKKIAVGKHTYRVEIRGGCTKDIAGTFVISENKCEKIFIDYYQIFNSQSNCDQDVIINQAEYENAPNHPVSIEDMQIEDNCLRIKFASSGCSGSTWVVKLIDMGVVAESYPCQRTLRLSLDNKEACLAVIDKEMSFNIEDLQIHGDNKVLLNISGTWILYEY